MPLCGEPYAAVEEELEPRAVKAEVLGAAHPWCRPLTVEPRGHVVGSACHGRAAGDGHREHCERRDTREHPQNHDAHDARDIRDSSEKPRWFEFEGGPHIALLGR